MTTQQTKVNWSLPIEAVHEDGRVVRVQLVPEDEYQRPHGDGTYGVDSAIVGPTNTFYADGTCEYEDSPWRVRNVAQPDHIRDTAKMVPTPSPELTARMVAFVREAADLNDSFGDRARSISAEFEKLNGDLVFARQLFDVAYPGGNPAWETAAVQDQWLGLAKHVRALAEAGN